ncbi:hypothetical protein [Streptomyces sp. NBC_00280]|uniref:hypothetical protein n=1 Tax=Streptomyces sp. NBC_00280 TaxID=2975699 RepID=UPI0032496916
MFNASFGDDWADAALPQQAAGPEADQLATWFVEVVDDQAQPEVGKQGVQLSAARAVARAVVAGLEDALEQVVEFLPIRVEEYDAVTAVEFEGCVSNQGALAYAVSTINLDGFIVGDRSLQQRRFVVTPQRHGDVAGKVPDTRPPFRLRARACLVDVHQRSVSSHEYVVVSGGELADGVAAHRQPPVSSRPLSLPRATTCAVM